MKDNPRIADLHWVRQSVQSRGQRTQRALLDAAEHLFADRGVEATTIVDIAKAAGSSVGSLYHHFRDKKALLYAIFERFCAEKEATIADAIDPNRWEAASIADIVHGYVEFTLRADRERPGFHRTSIEATRDDPVLQQRYDALRIQLDEGLTDLFLDRRNEIGHPHPELAVAFVLEQLGTMLQSRLVDTRLPTRLGPSSDDDVTREAVRSVGAYLAAAEPAD